MLREVFQCPHCQLRFLTNWEMLDHLSAEHHEVLLTPARHRHHGPHR